MREPLVSWCVGKYSAARFVGTQGQSHDLVRTISTCQWKSFVRWDKSWGQKLSQGSGAPVTPESSREGGASHLFESGVVRDVVQEIELQPV